MQVLRRCAVGVAMLAVWLAGAAAARAQILKQLPADPWVVFKVNNPQAISVKLAAMAEKLGLSAMLPAFKDPLGALKQQANLKEGLDDKGEAVLALYPPKEDGGEPRVLTLIPVTDYKAFLRNMQNVATEGELTKFTTLGDNEPLFSVLRGSHAVISPFKDLVEARPAGVDIAGLSGKQLQGNDVTVFANVKLMGAKALPMLQAQRAMILAELDGDVPAIQPQFKSALKAAAVQALNFAENVLKQGQAATLGLTLNDKGINATLVGEFDPAGSIGQTIKNVRFSDASLLAGLPNRKYFAFGGAVIDGPMAVKIFDEAFAPVRAELAKLADARTILQMVDGAKSGIAAENSFSFGYAAPTGPGQAIEQQVAVINGDAQQIQAVQRQMLKDMTALMAQIMPANEGSMAIQVTPDAKTVEGAKLDVIGMQMKFGNGPEAVQAQQMLNLLYGPNGMNGVMGAVSNKTMLVVMCGSDELIADAVKSARAMDDTLAAAPHIKAVADQLPRNRAAVAYIALDTIITETLKVMEQFGFKVPLKLAPDLPPVGISAGTDGSAVRIDVHLSTELISNLTSAALQVIPMIQGGGAPQPPATRPGAL